MASVRRDKGLSPCWTEPISSGSEMDPLLVKAESISNTSVMTYLRKGKKCCTGVVRKKNVKRERNNPADMKVSEEREGSVAPGTRAVFPLQLPMEKTTVKEVVPLQ